MFPLVVSALGGPVGLGLSLATTAWAFHYSTKSKNKNDNLSTESYLRLQLENSLNHERETLYNVVKLQNYHQEQTQKIYDSHIKEINTLHLYYNQQMQQNRINYLENLIENHFKN